MQQLEVIIIHQGSSIKKTNQKNLDAEYCIQCGEALFTKKIVEVKQCPDCKTNYEITDKFCDVILNKHIQEAAEHGTIYLEHEIRPNDIKKKIQGIILPKKAGGFFFDLDKCIKKIYNKIKKQYKFHDVINKEYSNLSKDWLKLSYDQKIEKLKQVLYKRIIPSLQLNNDDITIHKIEFDNRIVVKISNKLEKRNHGAINYMIKIENFFKNHIDKRLELFVIEKKDANILRHSNSPQKI